eukprot:8826573-Pyramimonas_sp.AAC.1
MNSLESSSLASYLAFHCAGSCASRTWSAPTSGASKTLETVSPTAQAYVSSRPPGRTASTPGTAPELALFPRQFEIAPNRLQCSFG